jgi:hypothetical protein
MNGFGGGGEILLLCRRVIPQCPWKDFLSTVGCGEIAWQSQHCGSSNTSQLLNQPAEGVWGDVSATNFPEEN